MLHLAMLPSKQV